MARKSRRDQLADKLTVKQQKAAYALLDNEMAATADRKNQEALAEELGIERMTLYRWRTQNQTFIEYKKEIAKDYLSDAVGIFAKQLIRSMEGTNGAPSSKALDLYAKIMGFVKSEHSVEITQGGGKTNEEIAQEIAALDELLNEDDATESEE